MSGAKARNLTVKVPLGGSEDDSSDSDDSSDDEDSIQRVESIDATAMEVLFRHDTYTQPENLTHKLGSIALTKQVRSLFFAYDTQGGDADNADEDGGDGELDREEFTRFATELGISPNKEEAGKLMDMMDQDKGGSVDLNEVVALFFGTSTISVIVC
jgi:hypothetical protein